MNFILNGRALLLVLLSCSYMTASAQTIVRGTVTDASTGSPIQYVSVYFKGGRGVVTDANGIYYLETNRTDVKTVEFSFTGYRLQSKAVSAGRSQSINVALETGTLEEVVVTRKRERYRNKDNPAVELIRHVIENKKNNKITSYDYAQYNQYEKMTFSILTKPEKLTQKKLFKNYKFILENTDTTKLDGKALLPVFLEEKASQKYFRKDPSLQRTYVLGNKRVNFGEFIDNNGLSTYLNRMYQDIDVYQNNIYLLTNQFISPIADAGPTFYQYYLRDTVEQDGIKLVRLYFTPRNPTDLLFRGTMFITLDGNYAVQKIDLAVSKSANLNWTRDLKIKQAFEKGTDGKYHVIMTNMIAEFALNKNSSGGIVGERTVSLSNYVINTPAPDSIYTERPEVAATTIENRPDSFWKEKRTEPLSAVEAKVYTNIDSLQNMRSFKRFMNLATLILAGYSNFGPWELGPVNAFYSFNNIEGFRLRVGGRTTPKFNKNIYFENYVAYGFKDQRWKYFAAGTYSFNHKSIYSFPLNYLRLSYQRDTKIPGQELQFVTEDNFLLSFKRGTNDRWLYNNIAKAEYVREFGKNMSYTLGYKYWKQTPAGSITYQKVVGGSLSTIPDVTTSELSAEFRWAPNEQFYQGKVYRIPFFNKYPIIRLRYIAGVKGLAGGEYNYGNFNLNIFKRFYLSQLGYADTWLEAGYLTGKVPYPLLTIHRANQTYAYQQNAYNLMNFMEFVSDRYIAYNIDYAFNGFIFNKIPLLKKLKLREAASFKIMYGGLRNENKPDKSSDAFKFPTNPMGQTITFVPDGKPYMEVSVGVANIFKLFRVDLVKRLTYLENPEVAKWGIRSRVRFDF